MAKKALALILIVLLALAFACPVFAETTIEHPKVIVYGNVTKTVYPGRNIFEYKDDQGLSSTLPFERQDENITINFANIVFSKEFENKSVASATETGSSALTLTRDVLTENGLEYIYLKITNSSALAASTQYAKRLCLEVSDEPAITNDYYIFTTIYVRRVSGANIDQWRASIAFTFVDSGASEREINIHVYGSAGTDKYGVWGPGTIPVYVTYGHDNEYVTVQLQISKILSETGFNWNLVKLTRIQYEISLTTGNTVDAENTIEAKIRHVLVLPSKVYIDDPAYTNGLIVNGTSEALTPQAGEVINVYGANCTKIVDITIPWQWEITPEIETDAENLQMQYTWTFIMPQSPTSSEADSLTFSNTNITLYGYKDGDAWDMLYLNGVDKLSNIASKEVDETTGYWTYGLASSLTEGNMYQVIARITYTADEYDALTEAPVFWTNPVAWIQYKFWELVIAIASFLGLGTAWAVRQKRKLRTPKR